MTGSTQNALIRLWAFPLSYLALCAMAKAWTASIPSMKCCPGYARRAQWRIFADSTDALEDSDHPLVQLGELIFDQVDGTVGNYLIQAGRAWAANDWDGTTEAMGEAAEALRDYIPYESETPHLWQAIAVQLEDISTIEGCSAVGPPASIPNWVDIQELLREAKEKEFASAVARIINYI